MGNVHTLTGVEINRIGNDQADRLGKTFNFTHVEEGRKKVQEQALELVNKTCSSYKPVNRKEACPRPGCTNLTDGGFCETCRKEMNKLTRHIRYHRIRGTKIGRRFQDYRYARAAYHRGELQFVNKGRKQQELVMT